MAQASTLNVPDVIDRMKGACGLKTDAELASHLDVSNKTVSSWRTRNSLPIEAVLQVAEETNNRIEYFLLGVTNERGETDFKFSDMRMRDFELAGIPIFNQVMATFADEALAFMSEEEVVEHGESLGTSIMGALAHIRQERRALLESGTFDEKTFDEYMAKSLRGDLPHNLRAIKNRQKNRKGPQ